MSKYRSIQITDKQIDAITLELSERVRQARGVIEILGTEASPETKIKFKRAEKIHRMWVKLVSRSVRRAQ